MKVKTPTFEKPASMKAWAKTPQAMKHPSLTPPPERFADESDDTAEPDQTALGQPFKIDIVSMRVAPVWLPGEA